ncbi:hypothetical protein OROGR_013794 [Orobanche gracilis]
MGSKVVVTYKRKRLFSRNDRSPINLHSNKPSEISDRRTSDNFDNHVDSVAQDALQNKDTELEKDADKLAFIRQKDSSVSNQTQESIQEQKTWPRVKQITYNLNVPLEESSGERCQIDSTGQCNTEEKSATTQSNSLFVNSGPEYGDKGKNTYPTEHKCNERNSILPARDALSGTESVVLISLKTCDGTSYSRQMDTSLEERDKLDKDQDSSFCNDNLVTKRKLKSTLITFCRRPKRNKDNAATDIASDRTDTCGFGPPVAASCSVDLKNEKRYRLTGHDPSDGLTVPRKNIGKTSSRGKRNLQRILILHVLFLPEQLRCTFWAMHVDNPLHSPHGLAKDGPTTSTQVFQNSHEDVVSWLEEKVCTSVEDDRRVHLRLQDLSIEDVNSIRMPSNISEKRGSLASLDLSISPPVSRDIDCNVPLNSGSVENPLRGTLEALYDSRGSTSEINNNMPTSEVQCTGNAYPVTVGAVRDKGKVIVESRPVENNCIQLFPENRSDETLQLANDPGNQARFLHWGINSSRIHNSSLPLGQIGNSHPACFSSLYDWPKTQPREPPLPGFLLPTSNGANSISRHLMMLDSILTRARGKLGFATTWSEEELDCLWIGVRRHGVNNWDAIITDPRLQFSPWKTGRDLAERWQDERYQLFHGRPISQVKCMARPDLYPGHTTSVQLSLGVHQNPLHECGARKRSPIVHCTDFARNRQFQKPINYLPRSNLGLVKPSEGSGFAKGNLPHWLREAVETPLRSPGPARNVGSSVCVPNYDFSANSQKPWVSTKNTPVQRKAETHANASLVIKSEPHDREANKKRDDLININSDASSEETISDDHSIRP